MFDFLTKRKIERMTGEEVSQQIEKLTAEIGKLEADLGSFAVQKENLVREKQTKIDELRTYLEDDKVIKAQEIKAIESQISDLKAELKKKSEELNTIKSAHRKDAEDLRTKSDEEITTLKKDHDRYLKDLKESYDQKLEEVKNAYENERHTIVTESDKTLTGLNQSLKKLDDEFFKIQAEIRQEQGGYKDAYELLIEQENAKKDTLASKSVKLRQEQLTKEEVAEKRLSKLQEDIKKDVANKKKVLDEGYEKMKEEFDTALERQKEELLELTKRKNELANAYNSALSDFNREKDILLSKYDQETSNIEFENQNLIAQEKKANDDLLALKGDLTKKENELAAFKVASQKEMDELKAGLEKKRQDLLLKHEADKANEESTLQQALEEMRHRYSEMKENLYNDKEKEISRLNGEFRMNQRRYLSKTKDIRTHADALKAEYEDKLASLRKANLILEDEIESDTQKHEIRLMSLTQKIEDEKQNWNRLLVQQQKEYNEKVENLKKAAAEHRDNFEKEKEELQAKTEALIKEKELKDLFYAKEITRYKTQLDSIGETKQAQIQNHEANLKKVAAEIEATKAKIESLTAENDRVLSELENRKAKAQSDLEQELAKMERAHQEEIIKINDEHAKECAKIESDYNEHLSARDVVFADLEKEHQNRLASAEEAFAKELADLNDQNEKTNAKFKQDAEQLERENVEKTQKIADLKKEYATLISDREDAIAALIVGYKEKIAKLKADFDKESNDLLKQEEGQRDAYNSDLASIENLIAAKRLELDQDQSDHEAKVRYYQELIADADHQKELVDNEYNLKLIDKNSEKETVDKELKKAYADLEAKTLARQAEYEELTKELSLRLEDQKTAYEREQNELLAQNEARREEVLAEYKQREDAYSEDLARKEENMAIEYRAKVALNDQKIASIVSENEEIFKGLKDKLESKKRLGRDLSRQYESVKEHLQNELNALKMSYNDKKNRLDDDYLNTRHRYQVELQNLKVASDDRLHALCDYNEKLRNDIKKMDEDQKIEIERNKKELEDLSNTLTLKKRAVDKAKEAYRLQLQDCEHLIETLRADYATKTKAAYDRIEEFSLKKGDLEREHKRLLKEAKKAHDENLNRSRKELDEKLQGYRQSQEAMIKAVHDQEEVIVAAYKNKLSSLEQEFLNKQADLENERVALESHFRDLINVQEDNQKNMKVDLEKINADLQCEIDGKRQDLKDLSADYQKRIDDLKSDNENEVAKFKEEVRKRQEVIENERQALLAKAKAINESIIAAKKDLDTQKEAFKKESESTIASYMNVLDDYTKKAKENEGKHSLFKF